MDPKAAERIAIMRGVFAAMQAIEQEYVELLVRLGCKQITLHRF